MGGWLITSSLPSLFSIYQTTDGARIGPRDICQLRTDAGGSSDATETAQGGRGDLAVARG